MSRGGVRSILLLSLVARCLETIDVCILYMAQVCVNVRCSDCVGVRGNACCVAAVVEDSVFSLGVLSSSCICCMFVCILWPVLHDLQVNAG